jgi:hypothetical protein
MRPYGKYWGVKTLENKILSMPFNLFYRLIRNQDNSPLGVAVYIKKI